uniref:Transmembrane protein 198 n=1 Tax=Gouania willdenowi TaxID=441366 RepID=A0A8C5ENU6_GOUWI
VPGPSCLSTCLRGVELCSLELSIKYEVLQSMICSVCFSFGLIYCFYGYRCFRAVMFFSGFVSSSGLVLLVYHREPLLGVHLGAETRVGVGLAAGLLCGLLSSVVAPLGLLLGGLQLGALLCLGVLVGVAQVHTLHPSLWPPALLLASSALCAVLMLRWQRMLSIVYASVWGGGVLTLCGDYLLGGFMLPDQVFDLFCQVTPPPLFWYNWTIGTLWPLLSFTGILVQWRVTTRRFSHSQNLFKKQKKFSKRCKYKDPRRRPAHYRRRRPPPLKRYAGDVLAPSFLQSLQDHRTGTSSSSSSSGLSSLTHTLIDFDFETGSMVPLTPPSPVYTV